MNVCIFTGRMVRPADLKKLNNGKSVCNFSVAVPRDFSKDKVDFLDFVAFDKTADFICQYFDKGAKINMTAHAQQSQFVDKNGNNRNKIEFVADRVEFGESRADREAPPLDVEKEAPPLGVDEDDNFDLPF